MVLKSISSRPAQLGTHWLIDLDDCEQLPTQASRLQDIMEHAARLVGATILSSSFHEFQPMGLSGVVVIGESHLAVHTWPEHRAACVDLFTCSPTMDAAPGVEYLQQIFAAGAVSTRQYRRGEAPVT
ncbi:MAG: adenosylmethionine decarboxylase [Pirellulaceae bacterium]